MNLVKCSLLSLLVLSFSSSAYSYERFDKTKTLEAQTKSFNFELDDEMTWALLVVGMIGGPLTTAGGAYSTYYGLGTGAAVSVGLTAGMTILGYIEDWIYDREKDLLRDEALDYIVEQEAPSHMLKSVMGEVRSQDKTKELSDLQIATLTYVLLSTEKEL